MLRYGALLICSALLVGSAGRVPLLANNQEARKIVRKGAQQDYEKMSPELRSAETREFLGLGAIPDKAAAARGAPLFAKNCAVCHGKVARGAMGPSLITSDRVLADEHGEELVPFLKQGSPEKGMPSFATMSDRQLTDVSEFLHLQVENVANRGTYKALNILVGDAAKGKAYVESHCMYCHKVETFAHIATKFRSPEQLQRSWIWPMHDEKLTAAVKTTGGRVSGRLTQISDFRITLVDSAGETRSIDRGPNVEVQMNDPLAPHRQLVMTLANDDMHNVTAYLATLK